MIKRVLKLSWMNWKTRRELNSKMTVVNLFKWFPVIEWHRCKSASNGAIGHDRTDKDEYMVFFLWLYGGFCIELQNESFSAVAA